MVRRLEQSGLWRDVSVSKLLACSLNGSLIYHTQDCRALPSLSTFDIFFLAVAKIFHIFKELNRGLSGLFVDGQG